MKVKIQRGQSHYITIPKEVIEYLKWSEGDTIEIDIPTTGSAVVLNKVIK